MSESIRVPDSGEGEVIELFVKAGDRIEAEQSLLTLESDKACMEIPSPATGVVESVEVKLDAELAEKARTKKLSADAMQGACFTISSLGHIGGTGFTPIVNAPEVAILGVSKAAMQPLSLSYDHRVINGAAAARFTKRLSDLLADIRTLLL